jgi:hypothetical protein
MVGLYFGLVSLSYIIGLFTYSCTKKWITQKTSILIGVLLFGIGLFLIGPRKISNFQIPKNAYTLAIGINLSGFS